MADRSSLQQWIVDALRANDGTATVVQIARHIWEHHEADLRMSGDLFYRRQYGMRWEGEKLQNAAVNRKVASPRVWTLLN